ncbi:unnamed protein product, partial [Adineta steineri]
YEINFNLESNFKINIEQYQNTTSYIWRAIQKENILFKIQQSINPLIGNKQIVSNISSSLNTKDFCYIIPHFDSKICLSINFKRLWPTFIAIRLLSDDPTLIYNLTSSNNLMHFNIQHNKKIFQSYHLIQKYNEHTSMPYYIEFSTPITNYTTFIDWKKQNIISFNFLKNNQSITNGSGLYSYDLSKGLSVSLSDIYPKHIGNLTIDYNGNLTINASKILGGELILRIDRLSDWSHGRIEMKVERVHYNDLSNIGFQSSSLINGWSLWNITVLMINFRQIQMQFNRYSFNFQINDRIIEFKLNYLNQKLLRSYFHINQSNFITTSLEIPGYHYESEGELFVNYTNFSLNLPIIETILEKTKKKSNIYLEFSSLQNNLILNITSNFRNEYSFKSIHNFTFHYNYFYQMDIQQSLTMTRLIHYQLLSFHLFTQYIKNSTILQLSNGSITLPSLFFSKPFLFNYERDVELFIQLFEWANLTRTSTSYNISTIFGLQLLAIHDFSTRIYIHFEQIILGKRYLLLFEIDRNWMISLIINKKIRYEFLSSPLNSLFLLKRINLDTNTTLTLPINYHTDNQTLIRIDIAFSKFFSKFINDFVLDISLKDHSFILYCHIPLFKREFFSLIWNRYVHKELFHFHGLIQTKFLRRRRFIDFDYNWNLASFRFWTLNSHITLFSLDPVQLNLNLTNDYLWYGKWAVDFRMMLSNRRELIRLNHKYHYTTFGSNLLFDLYLMNSHYDLDFNYYHLNHSIQGLFIKNKYKNEIDGYWNATTNTLQLNTQHMKSVTIITSTFIKSIIDRYHQKIGVLLERTEDSFTNDTQILECNPYFIIHTRPRLLIIHYYTLNDGLSTMTFEWLTRSYLSWNYTGHGQTIFPITKIEIDLRTKYIFHLHTTTFKYSCIYNNNKHRLILRRQPISEYADDHYELKLKYYQNRTFSIHLQVINNHYEIIGNSNSDDLFWKLHGYFRKDQFNGSLLLSNNDWYLSSKLNINSSLYISTGQYVQLIPTLNPQIALEIFLESYFHFAFQYANIQSLIALKFIHNSSDINLFFSSKSINETMFNISFQLNNIINQNWILEIHNKRFYLYNDNSEFIFNGSLQDFSFQHFIENKKMNFLLNENTIEFLTPGFGLSFSNFSSDTSRYIFLYHRETKQNLTINYYKSGRFLRDNLNIQTPIYDISIIYNPTDNENQYIKLIFELLPLQMSSFNLIRGRSFRIGYQTQQKQMMLSGNLAFSVEDIDNQEKIYMNERWKLIYGYDRSEKIYIKWNININSKEKTLHGKINIDDPNQDRSIPIYSDLNAQIKDMMLIFNMSTIYSSSKPILLQINIDQRILTQQYISLKLFHELSKTNLSLTIDHYPQRRLHIRFKPNNFSSEKTYVHLYANTTESQIKLLVILWNYINLNLTLPKSYPETGLLHSSLFINNEEYFDGRFDTTALKLRSKSYLFNLTLNQLILQQRYHDNILASVLARWIHRNSSTALVTIFSKTDFKQKLIPIWQSSEQPTWLNCFKQFLFENNLTSQFLNDIQEFSNSIKNDIIHAHEQSGIQLLNYLNLDDDFKLGIEKLNYMIMNLTESLFQIGFAGENLLQEYMNNLTCLINHQNLLHLDIDQLTTLLIDTFAYETVSYVNKTLIMFNHFTHYPRSMNAIISYISNEIIVEIHKFINDFYLQTKKFCLSKIIQYLYELDFLIKISPLFSDSITFFASNDIREFILFFNDRLRQLLSLWLHSPMEYKLMKTIASQLIEFIDKLRFYIDDKLDFLLPTLQIFTPRLSINGSSNQTFLLTWLKQYNITNIIDEQ